MSAPTSIRWARFLRNVDRHLPYSGPNVYNVMRAKTAEDPQPPTAFKPDLDPKLEEIVLHAIERNPRDRYATASQMLEDLRDPSRVVPQNDDRTKRIT